MGCFIFSRFRDYYHFCSFWEGWEGTHFHYKKLSIRIVKLKHRYILESAGDGGLMPRGLSGSLGLGLGSLFGMMPLVCGCVTAHWGKMVVSNLACWVGITAPPTAGWLSKGIPLSERNSSRSQYCWNQIKNTTLIKTKKNHSFLLAIKILKNLVKIMELIVKWFYN